jgi:antitoxin component of RelBE/YafQ-DinJ toxin-antitoxin module
MSTNLYAPPVKSQEDIVTFAVRMPKTVREQFKAHCAKHNLDMSEVIRRFILAELDKSQ